MRSTAADKRVSVTRYLFVRETGFLDGTRRRDVSRVWRCLGPRGWGDGQRERCDKVLSDIDAFGANDRRDDDRIVFAFDTSRHERCCVSRYRRVVRANTRQERDILLQNFRAFVLTALMRYCNIRSIRVNISLGKGEYVDLVLFRDVHLHGNLWTEGSALMSIVRLVRHDESVEICEKYRAELEYVAIRASAPLYHYSLNILHSDPDEVDY